MELTNKQQALLTLASMEAKGDINGLKNILKEALKGSLTINEAKEALSHLYAYTGFPRSLNGLNALQQVVAENKENGIEMKEGRDADALPRNYNAVEAGTIVQKKLTGVDYNYAFAPQTDYYLKAHLFGDIFSRNTLSYDERELVTVGAISALEGCGPQLVAHISGSRNMGISDAQVLEIPEVLYSKVGYKEANRAIEAINKVLNKNIKFYAQEVDFNVYPKGQLNTAYAKYFIGNSYLAPLGGSNSGIVNVTFEPSCRNNWHIHHKGVQVLVCVSGRGWYQEWGKEPVEMTPGVVIAVPEGVKHWHGAAKDSWLQHLASMRDVKEGASTEWLEPVNDDVYSKLK